jgi:tetratricopeptide (TPR) repeat protein
MHGNTAKALTLLNDAVTGAKTLGAPESVWPSLMALGDCYREKHDFEKALKCFIEAFSIIRESAQYIPQKSLRTRYLSDPAKRALAERLEEMSALVA